jgi:hypothetical protein
MAGLPLFSLVLRCWVAKSHRISLSCGERVAWLPVSIEIVLGSDYLDKTYKKCVLYILIKLLKGHQIGKASWSLEVA